MRANVFKHYIKITLSIILIISSFSVLSKNTKQKRIKLPFELKAEEQFKEQQLKQLKVIKPFSMNGLAAKFSSWGITSNNSSSSINLKDAWKKHVMRKEIIVAVIDTGIDPTHPFLHENIYVKNSLPTTANFGRDFSKINRHESKKNRLMPIDTHGHGTHVAGIIRSVFPKVKLMILKYYNPSASGKDNLKSTIAALRYAVKERVDIINYSGGGPDPDVEELKVLKEAEAKGILVVAAAGNEESNIDIESNAYFPASYGLSNIITVSAHGKKLKTLSSSNYGKSSVDIAAPGYRIKSSTLHGTAGFLTGTSQSTAFVTGVAALIKSTFPFMNAKQIKKAIIKSSKKEPTLIGKSRSNGRIDAGNAMSYAKKTAKRMKMLYRKVADAAKKKKEITKNKVKATIGKIIYRKKRRK